MKKYFFENKIISVANIKFNIISKKNPANLNVRFYHGKNIDCNAKSNILIDPNLWSNKMQSLKPSVDRKLKKHYLEKIDFTKSEIIFRFNDDFSSGKIINSMWLNNVISELYKRPATENDYKVYFVPFIENFIEDSKTRVNPRTGKKNINKNNSKI